LVIDYVSFWTRLREGQGLRCPCCGRYAKIYKRRLNAGIILNLVKAYKQFGTAAFDLPVELPERDSSTITTAKHWKLIVRRSDLDTKRDNPKRRRGESTVMWQITEYGEEFINGELDVRTYAKLFDDEARAFCGSKRGIRALLEMEGFDYDELMS
jgi:hypothetical protein